MTRYYCVPFETRRWAVEAQLAGAQGTEIAQSLGLTQACVWNWKRKYLTGGWDALRDKPHYKATPEHIREMK